MGRCAADCSACVSLLMWVFVCLNSVRCVTALWVIWKLETACGSTSAWCTVRTALKSPEVKNKRKKITKNKRWNVFVYNVSCFSTPTEKWRRWFASVEIQHKWILVYQHVFGWHWFSCTEFLTRPRVLIKVFWQVKVKLQIYGTCEHFCNSL